MASLFILFLWFFGGVLLFFASYQFLFMLLSTYYWLFTKKSNKSIKVYKTTKFGIIIPAHNEEILIGGLINSIHDSNYPKENVHTYVIADNCGEKDKTAEIAASLGADVRIRKNLTQRGKPYALSWLISSIDLDAHDAYVIIDADTVIDREFLSEIDSVLKQGHNIIQGYFGVMNPDENWLTRLSILPGVLKFILHFPGKKLLNLSCPLAGNGMCFTRAIFKQYGWSAYSVAENWEYYIQLTLKGHRVTSAEKAVIFSQVANSLKIGKDQRQRWQRGRIDTLVQYWKALLVRAITCLEFAQIDALIEVLRPSHSMLLLWSACYFLVIGLANLLNIDLLALYLLASIIIILQVVYFLTGLIVQRAPLTTWLSLLMVPPYLAWKLLISISGIIGRKNSKWIKTERH